MSETDRKRVIPRSAAIAVAMGVMNLSTYAFTMLAAHILGPRPYGAFAAVMNLLLVLGVASLGLQATAARRIAADPQHADQIADSIRGVAWRTALLVGVVLLLAAPALTRLLHLQSPLTAVVVALSVVPLTVMGGQAGILQGERRWGPLAAVYLAAGLPRLAIGTALILLRPTETWATIGVALGMVAPVLVGGWVLRRKRGPHRRSVSHRGWALAGEAARSSQVLLVFFTLANVDIVVARNVLDEHQAGLYAAGLILTKAMLFLPQFVVVVAFPAMSDPRARIGTLGRGLALIAALGLGGAIVAGALGDLVLILVGGQEFAAITSTLWLYALLGSVLSMLQLLVYSALAQQTRRAGAVMMLALVTLILLGTTASSRTELVLTVLVVDATLLAALLALAARGARARRALVPPAVSAQ